MNLNKGCIEIIKLPKLKWIKCKMNLNKGCIEIVRLQFLAPACLLDEP